jgi:hypothetical protein
MEAYPRLEVERAVHAGMPPTPPEMRNILGIFLSQADDWVDRSPPKKLTPGDVYRGDQTRRQAASRGFREQPH